MIRRLRLTPCPFLVRQPTELVISGPVGWLMRKMGWAGFTVPVPFVGTVILYWRDEPRGYEEFWSRPHPSERYHELVHAQQIAKHGALWYVTTWLYDTAVLGYNSPFHRIESPAREATEAAEMQGWPEWV